MIAARRILLPAAALLVTLALGTMWKLRRNAPVALVSEGEVHPRVTARAVVEARDGTAEVRAEAFGRVRTVAVRIGDHVEEGQLLAEIEPKLEGAELERHEAEFRASSAEADAVTGGRVDEVHALEADVRASNQAYLLAHADAERDRTLYEHGAVPKHTVEESTHREVAARAQLDSAQARLHRVQSGARSSEIRAARERAEAARARTKMVQHQIERYRITAPMSGTVLARNIDPGDTVPVQIEPILFEIADVTHTQVRFELEGDDALAVKLDAAAEMTSIDSHTPLGNGRVGRLAAQMRPRTIGTAEARVRAAEVVRTGWIDDVKGDFASLVGQEIEVNIELGPRFGLTVPRSAIFVEDGRAFVRLSSGPLPHERSVELIDADEHSARIRGIPSGTEVHIR